MFGYNKKEKIVRNILVSFCVFLVAVVAIGSVCLFLPKVFDYLGNLVSPAYKGPVKVERLSSGWTLTIGGKPFFVKGVCYQYTPVGKGPSYDLYSSVAKPWLVDGALMKRMGVNAVRIYGTGRDVDDARELVRDLFTRYGIKTAMGHALGLSKIGVPDYSDREVRDTIKNEVLAMVRSYKDEDGILFWILGKNNSAYFPADTREERSKIYYMFVNDLAESIKAIDPNHPVVMGKRGIDAIELARKYTESVDILGGIDYSGESFGAYFSAIKAGYGKPDVLIEFGADRYDANGGTEAQNWQAAFVSNQWNEIEKNKAGLSGSGISLGGFVFEWTDEWWRSHPRDDTGWAAHDTSASTANPAYHFDATAGKNMNDEWWGIVALDPDRPVNGLERRVPTQTYTALRSVWTTPLQRFMWGVGDFLRSLIGRIIDLFSGLRDSVTGIFRGPGAPKGPVKVIEKPNGWALTVGGKPFFVKGVCYQYIEVGKDQSYDMFSDSSKPWLVDGALMKKMGVNAVRLYAVGRDARNTKAVIRDLFEKFGIKTAVGHYLGFWEWPPANYGDPVFAERMKTEVLQMVEEYKNEDGILFWIIGNENNYSFDQGVRAWSTPETESLPPLEARRAKAKIYYSYINDLAKAIKKIDPNHPVVMGNGELASIDVAKQYAPDVDILGGIIYQGKTFGTYFDRLKRNFGKPNVFIEFGSDRYDSVWQQEAEDWQAFFLKLQWLEIWKNRAGGSGAGNSLGGFVFEWQDEWWKHNPDYAPGWPVHDTGANWANTAYYFDAKAGNNMSEEWWGLVSLDPKQTKDGIEKRVPTKAYYVLKELWTAK